MWGSLQEEAVNLTSETAHPLTLALPNLPRLPLHSLYAGPA